MKSKVGGTQIDLKNLEKLSYMYQNEAYKFSQL